MKKCAWSCWLSQSPDGIRRVGQAWRNKLSRLAGNHAIGRPRISRIRGRP